MTLAQVNPLIQGAVKLQERGRVSATLTPKDLRLPCDSALLQVEPLKLQLGQGQMMGQLFELLKLPGTQQGRQGQQQGQEQLLEAWTGPMEVVIESSGKVLVRRLDMLMGELVSSHGLSCGCVYLGRVPVTNSTLLFLSRSFGRLHTSMVVLVWHRTANSIAWHDTGK